MDDYPLNQTLSSLQTQVDPMIHYMLWMTTEINNKNKNNSDNFDNNTIGN